MLLKQPVNINVDPTRSSKEVHISLLCLKKKRKNKVSGSKRGGKGGRAGPPQGSQRYDRGTQQVKLIEIMPLY